MKTNKKSHHALSSRLQTYRQHRTSANPAIAATTATLAAVAAWTGCLLPVDNAEAVVNTFGIGDPLPGPPGKGVGFDRFGTLVATAFGSSGTRLSINRQLSSMLFVAAGPGSSFLAPFVPPSALIGPGGLVPGGTNFAIPFTPYPATPAGIVPLHVVAGGNSYFGWLAYNGNGAAPHTIGFSDQPGVGVFAGTLLEAGGPPAVPEPSTSLPLLLLGAAGVAINRRRRNVPQK